jgi:molybdate transport system substrate-binding protein
MGNQTVIRWSAGSLLVVALLVFGLIQLSSRSLKTGVKPALQIFCAASLKGPLEELAKNYEQSFGTRVVLQFGGSGTLLTTIDATKSGDVFIPADSSYFDLVREKKLGKESVQIATMRPVLAVAKGNPKQVHGWKDLLDRPNLKIGLCHPESAAIGKTIQTISRPSGDWEKLKAKAAVMKSTVSELAVDLKAGALDAAFLWDQTVASVGDLEIVECPELSTHLASVPVIVLTCSKSPLEASHFQRWIAEHSSPVFQRHHYVKH